MRLAWRLGARGLSVSHGRTGTTAQGFSRNEKPVHYDVVIVGGRIAGNTTAIYAAQAGLRVLVLDNSRTVGCPVQCGEFLPDVDEHFPAYRRYYADVPIPATLMLQRTEWIRVFSPRGR